MGAPWIRGKGGPATRKAGLKGGSNEHKPAGSISAHRRPRARRLGRWFKLERGDQAAAGRGSTGYAPANPLRGISIDSAYINSFLDQIPGPVLAVAHSYGGAVLTNSATNANNVLGLVYVAAFAPDEGEPLGAIASNSKDSVVFPTLIPLQYPTGEGQETAVEFTIDPEKFHEVFAFDLNVEQSALMAATQRPLAELVFSEPTGVPAWKNLPSWAVVASGDKVVGTDAVRSIAERAGATITEVEGSQ